MTGLQQCRFCGKTMGEGFKVPSRLTSETIYVCWDCGDFILHIVQDNLAGMIREVMNVAEGLIEEVEIWNIDSEKPEARQADQPTSAAE